MPNVAPWEQFFDQSFLTKLPFTQDFGGVFGNGVQAITVDNQSGLFIGIGSAANIVTKQIPPYQLRSFIVPQWSVIFITNQGGAITTGDFLQVDAYQDIPAPSPLALSFPVQGASPGWGSQISPNPNILNNIVAGMRFNAWNIQQVINLLTGIMTGQPVTIDNTLTLGPPLLIPWAVASGLLGFGDSTTPGNSPSAIYYQNNILRIGQRGSADLALFDFFAKRFEVAVTGASGKPLTNYIPSAAPFPITNIATTGALVLYPITGLPTSAIAADISIRFLLGTGSYNNAVASNIAGDGLQFILDHSGSNLYFFARVPILTPSNIAVASAGNNADIRLLGYHEPS